MGAMTEATANKLLDHVLGTAAFTPPTAVYVALRAGGAEVSGGGYARQRVVFSPAAAKVASNTANVTFPRATANWGVITGLSLFTAQTGGSEIVRVNLTSSVDVNVNDTAVIPVGALVVTID